jgi:hypothetical protein
MYSTFINRWFAFLFTANDCQMSLSDKILTSFIHAYLYDNYERKRNIEGIYLKYTSNYSVFVQIF